MARVWADQDGAILRVTRDHLEEARWGAPASFVSELAFDEEVNSPLIEGLVHDPSVYRLIGGILTREASPIPIAPDGEGKQIRDMIAASITQLEAYRQLSPPTAAQTVTAVKLMARILIYMLRRL